MAKGDRITASRFNAIRNNVVRVMGVGSGEEGYGQQTLSQVVVPGQSITSTIFNNLRTDIAKAYSHQTGEFVVNTNANELVSSTLLPPNLDLVDGSTQITNALLVQYENFAANILTNRSLANVGQLTSGVVSNQQRTTAWGGASQTQSVSHTVTLTFNGYTQGSLTVSGADHARAFFNAGGTIDITASRSGGTVSTKNTTWTNMLSQFGTLRFGAASTSITGSTNTGGSVGSSVVFTSLTVGGAAQQMLFQPGPSGVYAENDYVVTVSRPTSDTLAFTITFRDNDDGDQTGLGDEVDENVDGTLTSSISVTRPFGDNVDIPSPTASSTTL